MKGALKNTHSRMCVLNGDEPGPFSAGRGRVRPHEEGDAVLSMKTD